MSSSKYKGWANSENKVTLNEDTQLEVTSLRFERTIWISTRNSGGYSFFFTFVDIFAPKHISFVELVTVMRTNASLF